MKGKPFCFLGFFDELIGRRHRLKRHECAFQQSAAGAASASPDCVDQAALVLDWSFEQRRYASYRARRMRVRACHLGYPEMTRYFQREHVLVLAACAVEHLDRID